jgi:hypothetical protein
MVNTVSYKMVHRSCNMAARAKPKHEGVPGRIIMWRPLTLIFTIVCSRIGLSRTKFMTIIAEMLNYNSVSFFVRGVKLGRSHRGRHVD